MPAVFTYAVRYDVKATCQTPLRTGGTNGDTGTVLRDRQGRAIIQGASITGALREWTSRNYQEDVLSALFGGQNQDNKLISGKLIVSDGIFTENAEQNTRPRLRIDSQMGTAAVKGKFDIAHLSPDAVFSFTLFWLGNVEDTTELETVEAMLGALHAGQIRLGAQKSNGFGRVTLEVRRRDFDMLRREDREAWMADAEGKPIALPEISGDTCVHFTVYGRADSILIRAASARQSDEKGSVLENITEGGVSILPGSSVKGAVRARAELIARAAGLGSQIVENLFGRGATEGDNGKAGKVRFEDVRLTGGNRQEITRIRINKFTGSIMRGGLFTEEPVSAPVTLTADAPEDSASCALLLFAFRDLGLKLYNLGSGGSIGRGYITVERIEAESADGRRMALTFEKPMGYSLEDPDGLASEWLKAWEVLRNG